MWQLKHHLINHYLSGDSTKTESKSNEDENTPSSKVVGKRLAGSVGSNVEETEVGERSINKPVKVHCVKVLLD